jgi:mRNA interferase MazF
MGVVASRFDVFLVRLDPTEGHEIQKTRPCLIISPNEMNRHIRTVLIAPMTSRGRPYPTRVPVTFQGTAGQIVLDQIRAVDNQRLVRKLGRINRRTAEQVLAVLAQMFAP